jgi:hypothetical protein
MRDVRAVLVLGVEKGDEGPFGPEKREMADGRRSRAFFTPSHPLAIPVISFRHGLSRGTVSQRSGP